MIYEFIMNQRRSQHEEGVFVDGEKYEQIEKKLKFGA